MRTKKHFVLLVESMGQEFGQKTEETEAPISGDSTGKIQSLGVTWLLAGTSAGVPSRTLLHGSHVISLYGLA